MQRRLNEIAPPRQFNRCAEEIPHVLRLTMHDEKNFHFADDRLLWRVWL
jgi:hypothetical protein